MLHINLYLNKSLILSEVWNTPEKYVVKFSLSVHINLFQELEWSCFESDRWLFCSGYVWWALFELSSLEWQILTDSAEYAITCHKTLRMSCAYRMTALVYSFLFQLDQFDYHPEDTRHVLGSLWATDKPEGQIGAGVCSKNTPRKKTNGSLSLQQNSCGFRSHLEISITATRVH